MSPLSSEQLTHMPEVAISESDFDHILGKVQQAADKVDDREKSLKTLRLVMDGSDPQAAAQAAAIMLAELNYQQLRDESS